MFVYFHTFQKANHYFIVCIRILIKASLSDSIHSKSKYLIKTPRLPVNKDTARRRDNTSSGDRSSSGRIYKSAYFSAGRLPLRTLFNFLPSGANRSTYANIARRVSREMEPMYRRYTLFNGPKSHFQTRNVVIHHPCVPEVGPRNPPKEEDRAKSRRSFLRRMKLIMLNGLSNAD